MDNEAAISTLAALAQNTRLNAFKALVRYEPDGLPAGEIARQLGVPQNTLSAHLSALAHARVVFSERRGRSIIYRANLARLRELTLFLVKDCCGGRSELCEMLAAELKF
jgi:ArsR family transcriptional regulator